MSNIEEQVHNYLATNGGSWSSCSIVDHEGEYIYSTHIDTIRDTKTSNVLDFYDDRTITVARGMWLLDLHYEIHRWHPPFIYGRMGDSLNLEGSGFAMMRAQKESNEEYIYVIISYDLPINSAKAVPELQRFTSELIKNL